MTFDPYPDSRQDWFLWYEHGGITLLLAGRRRSPGWPRWPGDEFLRISQAISDVLCAVTDGNARRKHAPSPTAWAESSF